MRRSIRFLSTIILAALAIQASGAAFGQNFAVAPRLYVRPGDTVYVDVMADSLVRGLSGVNLLLDYREKSPTTAPPLTVGISNPNDASELRIGPMVPNPLLALDLRSEEIDVALVCLSNSVAGYGPGLVVSIPLQVPKAAPPGAIYGLFLLKHEALDLRNDFMVSTATPGLLHVDPSPPLPGDLNGDGKVDIADAVIALRLIAMNLDPTDRQLFAGDFTHDNRINVVDVVRILRLAVGL